MCKLVFALLVAAGLAVCFAIDSSVMHAGLERSARSNGRHRDLYNLFRVMGYLPTWGLVGLALMLCRPLVNASRLRNVLWAFAPLLSAALSGGLAAVLKLVFRRVRADEVDGAWYVFRSFSDRPWKGSGLSMPSEHAAVAFGAAFMLSRMYPRGWPVFMLMGVGCAVSRLVYGDHFPSDVYVSGVIGFAVAWLLTGKKCKGDQRNPDGGLAA